MEASSEETVFEHFGHGLFGHWRFGQDISAMDILVMDISAMGVSAKEKNIYSASAEEIQPFTTL